MAAQAGGHPPLGKTVSGGVDTTTARRTALRKLPVPFDGHHVLAFVFLSQQRATNCGLHPKNPRKSCMIAHQPPANRPGNI